MDPQKDLTLTEIILKLHQDYPGRFALFYGTIAFFILLGLIGVWQIWGPGPRRRRGLRAAKKLLQSGNWQGALNQLTAVRAIGSPSASWMRTFDEFEAECMQGAVKVALKEKKFEEALQFGLTAAQTFEKPTHEVRIRVQNAMLAEIRRLFAKTGETDAIIDLVIRTLHVQAPCREASFWQAMCEIRLGALDAALMHLQVARTGVVRGFSLDDGFTELGTPGAAPAPPSPYLDPPLYLGAILLRTGQAKDALRFLTEANRMDANCPFITLQLGAAIVTAGGDTNMAVRALQRALGPKGLGQWIENPDRAWVEAFPEHRSYIRKLAEESTFVCPLFGEDMKYLLRQGNLALAQGQFKLNNFQEAAELFDKVLKEGAPSLPVLRGLGLSLAKLGRFDDAFIHLRTAHEMEDEKDRLTAGYLALCGAAGKARPEDKLQNIAWAIRLVTQFNVPGDAEWVGLLNRIFAEARANGIPVTTDDQLYLCEHLVSVKATDATAAQAFHFLMATEPALAHPEYAWLYCRADLEHNVGGDRALALYALAFSNRNEAQDFYSERGWNLEDVELMFLRRAAEQALGRFPEILGANYLPRGEQILLDKARELEAAGQREEALQTIEVLVKLSPGNTSAMDRAAALHFRAGRMEPAFQLLEQWRQTQSDAPLPLVRQAIILHEQADDAGAFEKLRGAMAMSADRRRANIAFLGARLALQSFLAPKPDLVVDANPLATVHEFLRQCLASDASHPHAQWCLAAVRWLHGEPSALAQQARQMQDAEVADPRYHYVAALCHLLGGNSEAALAAAKRVTDMVGANGSRTMREIVLEAGYVAGLAHLGTGDFTAAIDAFKPMTFNPASPTASYAQAQLAAALFHEERHEEAIGVWQALDPHKRQTWGLSDALAQTTFITALELLQSAKYEEAAERFRQAGRSGVRDRRLGPLLLLALFKAGQQAIYANETAPVNPSLTVGAS